MGIAKPNPNSPDTANDHSDQLDRRILDKEGPSILTHAPVVSSDKQWKLYN